MSLSMQEILPDGGLASFQNEVSKLADLGRYEDAYIVHAAEGETIVPMAVFDENPRLKAMLFAQMRGMGIDPQRYIVGSEFNSINPITGQPEFFLKKIFKEAKKAVKTIAPYAGVIAGAMGAGPMASAGIGALGGYYGEGDLGGALKGGLYGYTAGKGFGTRKGGDYIFGEGAKGDRWGQLGRNLGFADTSENKKLQEEAIEKIRASDLDAAEKVKQIKATKELYKTGMFDAFTGMDWKDKALLGATAMYGLSDIASMGKDDSPMATPHGWDSIYPSNTWYGNWAAPGTIDAMAAGNADGGIIQKFNEGSGEEGVVDIDLDSLTWGQRQEYDDLVNIRGWKEIDAFLSAKSMDLNTGGIVQLAEGTGPRGVHPGTEQEGYQFDFDVDGENRTYSFDQQGLTDQARQEFLAREGIMPTAGGIMRKKESDPTLELDREKIYRGIAHDRKSEFLARGEITPAMVEKLARAMKFGGRINDDDRARALEMLQTGDPEMIGAMMEKAERNRQMINEFFSIGEEGSPHDYTESKYADGGIAHLSAGAFPRMTGAIAGPGGPKDDMVPAMLSDGEFVMTADAVRNAGGGSRREGARRMYQLMNQLEQGAMV